AGVISSENSQRSSPKMGRQTPLPARMIAARSCGATALEFSVNREKRIETAIVAVIVAHEAVRGPNLNVSMVPVSVNEHRADRRLVRIADWQAFESVALHQLIAGFSRVGCLGIGIDHARRKQGVLHIMPALLLRFRMRALLRERRGAGKFRIEAGINFGKRMNDRLLLQRIDEIVRGGAAIPSPV